MNFEDLPMLHDYMAPTLFRRLAPWDYRKPGAYHVVFDVCGRRPVLGELVAKVKEGAKSDVPPTETAVLELFEERPYVSLSPLGQRVSSLLDELSVVVPQVEVLCKMVMPDHLHLAVSVKETLPQELPVGVVFNEFLDRCDEALHELQETDESLREHGAKVFADEYHDCHLYSSDDDQQLYRHILDNPLRVATKRYLSHLFVRQYVLKFKGVTYVAIGNAMLLNKAERVQVKCHRSMTETEIQLETDCYLFLAQHGSVLVSPCISEGEQRIMRAARMAGHAIITILVNGFAQDYVPSGPYREACLDGRLLMLAPFPHQPYRPLLNRALCDTLNNMASSISSCSGFYDMV